MPHKAIDALVSAFAILAPHHRELDLLIAGEGPDRARLEAQIASAGLSERVLMLGGRTQSELWRLYKGARLFVMPSRAVEGLGLVFLEAMACGTPVVATRSGGTPEVVIDGETGLLVDRNEPGKIAAAMRSLIEDHELRARLGVRGMHLAQRYAWRGVADRYLEVYRRCLTPGRA